MTFLDFRFKKRSPRNVLFCNTTPRMGKFGGRVVVRSDCISWIGRFVPEFLKRSGLWVG